MLRKKNKKQKTKKQLDGIHIDKACIGFIYLYSPIQTEHTEYLTCICLPAGTWRLYNVGLTSMQRHDVASTLRRRCMDVMCLLGCIKHPEIKDCNISSETDIKVINFTCHKKCPN